MGIKRLTTKLKPVLLLCAMSLVAITVVWVVNQFKNPVQALNQTPKQSNIVQNTQAVSEQDSSIAQVVQEDTQPVVLSAVSNSCTSDTYKIESYSTCYKSGTASIDFTDGTSSGDRVSKNSNIYLTSVTIPLELFSGSDVKDSNRKITAETSNVYKPAGEQIDEKVANVLLPPGTNVAEHKGYVVDTPVSTTYSVGFGPGEDRKGEDGEVGLDEELKGNCEECNNRTNVNPDKSNKIAEFIDDVTHRYPGQKDAVTAEETIEECGETDRFEEWSNNNRYACQANVVDYTVELIKQIPQAMFNRCNGLALDENGNPLPSTNECIRPEDIVIKMSSMFGSDKDCIDGVCTNTYMKTRNKIAMTPTDSSSYTGKFYYTTDCTVLIEAKSYTVKCAWDMSHLFKERKFSEFDDLPEVEDTPSEEAYNDMLLQEGIRRTGETPVTIN